MLDFIFFKVNIADVNVIISDVLLYFTTQSSLGMIVDLFWLIGWIGLFYACIKIGLDQYGDYRGNKYTADWEWVVLAIDIPALNVQTPKAVEQMFSHLAGAHSKPNIGQKFRGGYSQRYFSFEIISIEGYIQFLVRTERKFIDLVEAAVYAQYPTSSITEVEDYTSAIPDTYPNETHDVWAADFVLAEDQAFPLRSYTEFEHSISKDTVLKDPMGTFLESFSRIGPGEQMWFQIIVKPISNSWKEKSIKKIKELIGDKSAKPKPSQAEKALDFIPNSTLKTLEYIGDQVFNREASSSDSSDDSGEKNDLKYLTPGQKITLEAMENKITKIGLETKVRAMYLARKEVFRPERGVQALVGAINQYNVPSANSLVPGYSTSASYFFKDWQTAYKKNLMVKAYKKRKMKAGKKPYVLNIEELATIWHFPMSHVATPNLQKATAKQSEPPVDLPTEFIPPPPTPEQVLAQEAQERAHPAFQTDAGDVAYGNEEFG